jgi:hypothetical protein
MGYVYWYGRLTRVPSALPFLSGIYPVFGQVCTKNYYRIGTAIPTLFGKIGGVTRENENIE